MAYVNEGQLDRALKKAIRNSGGDPGDKYRQALRDRFLCRVFNDSNARFVLKGGGSLLARIPDGRATRDIDFATSTHESAETALAALNSLVERDLGDFLTFRLTKREESLDENGYSRLLKLRYATFMGQEEKDPILIDLSLDCETTLPPERIKPANRIGIDGLVTCDYLVYPLPDQLADKLCAIMELQPGGYQSSRMKDLVDVVFYITNESFSLRQLHQAIASECERRDMKIPKRFSAPTTWKAKFLAFAKRNGVSPAYASFDAAISLAATFFDPALQGTSESAIDATWDPNCLRWS